MIAIIGYVASTAAYVALLLGGHTNDGRAFIGPMVVWAMLAIIAALSKPKAGRAVQ